MIKTFIVAFSYYYLIISSTSAYSQGDLPLSVLPTEYNGSFAGETGSPRINLNTMLQTGSGVFKAKGFGQYISYDQFISPLSLGIGVMAGYTSLDYYFYSPQKHERRTSMIGFALAPKLSIKGKYTLSPSLDLVYLKHESKREDDPEHYLSESIGSRAGLLINNKKSYLGVSFLVYQNTNRHQYNYFRSYLQVGHTFQRSSDSKFSFTPQLVMWVYATNKMNIELESIMLNFRLNKFIWGFNNAGLHVGWQTNKTRIMLSNGFGFSSSGSRYKANVSLRYVFSERSN